MVKPRFGSRRSGGRGSARRAASPGCPAVRVRFMFLFIRISIHVYVLVYKDLYARLQRRQVAQLCE